MSILLATLNSSYKHSAFGLRYIFANLEELQAHSKIREFTIAQKPRDIAEQILKENPQILGLGVYIWNTTETLRLVSLLKRIKPELIIVLGGPEISFETEDQELTKFTDYIIQGEADFLFRDLCRELLQGIKPTQKIITGPLPDINLLKLPYDYFTDEDVRNRVIYVEASRGCPYKCEYCLSSLDKQVRNIPIDAFLEAMEKLIQRGATQFKFVDRTFNLSATTSNRILDFFLARISLGLFLHFELVPDRLPEELRDRIAQFPAGSLQFEIGIQTWNPEVSALVSRRQNYEKIRENFAYLKTNTHVHTHADLIAGLPGESLASFAAGFDALAVLSPDEIQVGILKRLKGTPIIRHDAEWKMIYDADPPFTVASTKLMSFAELQQVNRFSRFWDMYANSGNFVRFMAEFRSQASATASGSLFWSFFDFVSFLYKRHGVNHGIALLNLVESAWIYSKQEWPDKQETICAALTDDYTSGKRDIPYFLRVDETNKVKPAQILLKSHVPVRQSKHLRNVLE